MMFPAMLLLDRMLITQLESSSDLLQAILALSLISESPPDGGKDLLLPSLDQEGIMVLNGLLLLSIFAITLLFSHGAGLGVWTSHSKVLITG